MKLTEQRFALLRLIWMTFLVFFIAGCGSVRLVASYDLAIENGVTDLQKKVEAILTKIERQPSNPSSTYDSKDYEKLREDLNVLRTRASAWDKNDVTVKMLYELGYQLLETPPTPVTEKEAADKKLDQIVVENSNIPMPTDRYFSLEKRHKMSDSLGLEDIRDLRSILEVHFRNLLKFETLKKRDIPTK